MFSSPKENTNAREARRVYALLFEHIDYICASDELQVCQFTSSPHREPFVLGSYVQMRNLCLQPRYALYVSNTGARPVTMEDQNKTFEIPEDHSQTLPVGRS